MLVYEHQAGVGCRDNILPTILQMHAANLFLHKGILFKQRGLCRLYRICLGQQLVVELIPISEDDLEEEEAEEPLGGEYDALVPANGL